MLKREANQIVGKLSSPGKMPGPGYSLPNSVCHVGGKLRKIDGSVCSGCYASQGRYRMPRQQEAMHRRLKAVKGALKGARARALFVEAMATLLDKHAYFRWHDSGDLISVDHLRLICEVARATPNTRHWLPTKEIGRVAKFLDAGGKIPKNLVIRVSAFMVGANAMVDIPPGVQTSTVHFDLTRDALGDCPAVRTHGTCDDHGCRKCWDKSVGNVSYGHHGHKKAVEGDCSKADSILAKELHFMV